MNRTAEQIYQANLDTVSGLLWARRFEEAAAHIALPSVMRTLDGTVRHETAEQLVAAMRAFRGFLDRMGAQDYHRICTRAAFVPGREDRIEGTHRTFVLRGGCYLLEPVENDMELVLGPGGWQAGGIAARVLNSTFEVLPPEQVAAARRAPPSPAP